MGKKDSTEKVAAADTAAETPREYPKTGGSYIRDKNGKPVRVQSPPEKSEQPAETDAELSAEQK